MWKCYCLTLHCGGTPVTRVDCGHEWTAEPGSHLDILVRITLGAVLSLWEVGRGRISEAQPIAAHLEVRDAKACYSEPIMQDHSGLLTLQGLSKAHGEGKQSKETNTPFSKYTTVTTENMELLNGLQIFVDGPCSYCSKWVYLRGAATPWIPGYSKPKTKKTIYPDQTNFIWFISLILDNNCIIHIIGLHMHTAPKLSFSKPQSSRHFGA